MPKVSIVMPVYNGEQYIREAIESIINQTFSDWEFLIINEYGSNEVVTKILEEYMLKDDRIIVYQNQSKLGISASMNIGLMNAKGEYIARMDSDDISAPTRLEKQVSYLDNNPHIGLLGIKPTVFGEEDWEWNAESNTEKVKAEALFFQPALHPTVMMRASILKENNLQYNPEYTCAEDFDLFVRMLDYCEISNIVNDKSLFYYRRYPSAATYKNQNKGDLICQQVMKESFNKMGLDFSQDELALLYLHTGLKDKYNNELMCDVSKLDLLLKQIFIQNMKLQKYDMDSLFCCLHKRWLHAYNSVVIPQHGGEDNLPDNIMQAFTRSIFWNETYYEPYTDEISDPLISVVLPLYNGQNYLFESILSIEKQTFKKWEMVIVNDASLDDGPLIVQEYMKKDKRIRLIHNEKNLKISNTLNNGIKNSRGVYIARMDDDDISVPDRFLKELTVLQNNTDISVVGSWQQHFGTNDWIHRPPCSADDMKAALLFKCEVCHSTVMFRKNDFLENELFYDPEMLSEDYDLWTRAIEKGLGFYTIPEVLGYYRLDGTNITAGKAEKFDEEARRIVARSLKNMLNLEIAEEDYILLSGWTNPFWGNKKLVERGKKLIEKIKNANNCSKIYNEQSLEQILNERVRWMEEGILDKAITKIQNQSQEMTKNLSFSLKRSLKKTMKRILRPVKKPVLKVSNIIHRPMNELLWDLDGHLKDSKDELKKTIWDSEGHLQERFDERDKLFLELKQQNRLLIEKLNFQDDLIKNIIERQNQMLFAQLVETEKNINQTTDYKIEEIVKSVDRSIDSRIAEIEGNINQVVNSKMREIESNIVEATNAKTEETIKIIKQAISFEIAETEKKINQTMDTRVWEAEKNINQTMDTRVWEAEKIINQTMDARVWNSEKWLEETIYSTGKQIRGEIWNALFYSNKQIFSSTGKENYLYNSMFYDDNRFESYLSAYHVLRKLLPEIKPESVCDFGCGTGTWLSVASKLGVADIVGFDGDYVEKSWLMIPEERFIPADLSKPLQLNRKFDMAMSLEVAEHIAEKDADIFIDNLCQASDLILFSAAHPGQGGEGHLNEQPQEYWEQKFHERGFSKIEIAEKFKGNRDICWWYRDNICIFKKIIK